MGMVAGSHNRNEFVMIRHDGDAPGLAKPTKSANGQVCQICGDSVGVSATGDVFIACNECAFPVCRPCYEYERKEGNLCCPQCKTRYKRHKGHYKDKDGVKGLCVVGAINNYNLTQALMFLSHFIRDIH
eukprot:XP_020404592.1 probable cellulose synthase A catalytic subunit 1 [UDP-forming] [Zea mays]